MATKKSAARKYSPAAGKSVEREMKAMQQGKLTMGRSGKKVTNPRQAIAIGLSEARAAGNKVPAPPSQAAGIRSPGNKPAGAKAPARKAPARKSAAKKAAAKKATAKKSV